MDTFWYTVAVFVPEDFEIVATEDDICESLVIEEHVYGGSVRHLERKTMPCAPPLTVMSDLSGVAGLVLHAAVGLLLQAGVLGRLAKGRHKVCTRDEPKGQDDIFSL